MVAGNFSFKAVHNVEEALLLEPGEIYLYCAFNKWCWVEIPAKFIGTECELKSRWTHVYAHADAYKHKHLSINADDYSDTYVDAEQMNI